MRDYEAGLKRKDGTVYFGLLNVDQVQLRGQAVLLTTVRDITERKRAEEQLRHAQKMEAVGRLAGGVAHDFNNLLQAMLSHVQLLLSNPGDPTRVATSAREFEQQIRRGAALTRQLLLFSRREMAKPDLVDLNEVINSAAAFLRRLARENIGFSLDLAETTLPVQADRGQLDQVLMNFVVNASDAMPDGGTLTLRTGEGGTGTVWFTVEDTGSGIPSSIRDQIFEPFFTTKGTGKGTGLGLAVVHGIVARQGGRIEVESQEGVGTTFRVVLPRAATGPTGMPSVEATELKPLEAGKGERVLVVEDEEAAREALREMLAALGYEVIAFGSGEEARRLPSEPAIDVLLTDLMLPGITGPELASGLLERWPGLKVVLMSGYTEDEALRRGIPAGSVRSMQKPFDMDTLAREIRAALNEEGGGG